MEKLLLKVEAEEDIPALVCGLIARCPRDNPVLIQKLAKELWGFLTLNLQGNAKTVLNNAPSLEGFEVWRRLVKPIRGRCELRRHDLRGKLQRPDTAGSISEIPAVLEKYDALMREYLESGGRRLSFEERRSALLEILPAKFREDIFFKVPGMQEMADSDLSLDAQDILMDDLRAKVQRQAELVVQWASLHGRHEKQAHVMQEWGDQSWESSLWPSQDEYGSELLYGAKGWQTKGFKGKGGYKGAYKGKGKAKRAKERAKRENAKEKVCPFAQTVGPKGTPLHSARSLLSRGQKDHATGVVRMDTCPTSVLRGPSHPTSSRSQNLLQKQSQ